MGEELKKMFGRMRLVGRSSHTTTVAIALPGEDLFFSNEFGPGRGMMKRRTELKQDEFFYEQERRSFEEF